MTALQRRILDALASSGGALCTVELRRQVQLRGSTSHLHRALGRLAERGLVVVTQREAWASSGPLIELSSARQSASAGRVSQTRPGTP